jgi:ribose 5-phosphate isomerase B
MKIYLGADHRGFKMKEQLLPWLEDQGHEVIDCGNDKYDPADDFPDYSLAVAKKVQQDNEAKGIVICGSGVGVNIAANKVTGIRASTGINAEEVKHARQHDDLNILAISADHSTLSEVQEMVGVFLTTAFEPEERFLRRLQKITAYEALS